MCIFLVNKIGVICVYISYDLGDDRRIESNRPVGSGGHLFKMSIDSTAATAQHEEWAFTRYNSCSSPGDYHSHVRFVPTASGRCLQRTVTNKYIIIK